MCVRVDACRPGHHAGGRPLRTTAPHPVLPSTSIYSSYSGQGLTGGSARGPGGALRVSVTVHARPRRQCRCCRCVLHLHVINNTSCYGVTQLVRGRQHVYVARREQQLSVARSWRAIDGMHARTHCECVRDPGSSDQLAYIRARIGIVAHGVCTYEDTYTAGLQCRCCSWSYAVEIRSTHVQFNVRVYGRYVLGIREASVTSDVFAIFASRSA